MATYRVLSDGCEFRWDMQTESFWFSLNDLGKIDKEAFKRFGHDEVICGPRATKDWSVFLDPPGLQFKYLNIIADDEGIVRILGIDDYDAYEEKMTD